MGTPNLEEIIEVTCRSRGITPTAGQVRRIAYAASKASAQNDVIDVLEAEIAALDAAHLDELIAAKERELDALRLRRRGMT